MIISDSTALITLINIEEFDLLKFFTQKILIPIEVYEEISIEEKDKRFLDAQIETKSLEVVPCENKLLFSELNLFGNNSPTLWVDSISPIENNLSKVTSL